MAEDSKKMSIVVIASAIIAVMSAMSLSWNSFRKIDGLIQFDPVEVTAKATAAHDHVEGEGELLDSIFMELKSAGKRMDEQEETNRRIWIYQQCRAAAKEDEKAGRPIRDCSPLSLEMSGN